MKNSYDAKLKFLPSLRCVFSFLKLFFFWKKNINFYFYFKIFRLKSLSSKKGSRTGNAANHLEQKVLALLKRVS